MQAAYAAPIPEVTTDTRVLVVHAHPAPRQSRVNRRLADTARDLPGVHVRDLYDTYPDFFIDAAREQALLEQASVLVLLHPLVMFGMPALLKEWTDAVFAPGWAYAGGSALRGKKLWQVLTSATPSTQHARPFTDFLAPVEQTAALCGMEWIPPLVLHAANDASDDAVGAHAGAFSTQLNHHLRRHGT